MTSVLIVDDDQILVEILEFIFKRHGYQVQTAANGNEARLKWRRDQPDLVLLDINLPEADGLALCDEFRSASTVPIIMLTARTGEDDIVRALELGADDYITKPFGPRELVARSRAVLRRASVLRSKPPTSLTETVQAASFGLDEEHHAVMVNDQNVHLTPIEFRIVRVLYYNRGKVIPTERIVEQVWGYTGDGSEESVKVHIHRLRRKIQNSAGSRSLIQTVPGVGYLFTSY